MLISKKELESKLKEEQAKKERDVTQYFEEILEKEKNKNKKEINKMKDSHNKEISDLKKGMKNEVSRQVEKVLAEEYAFQKQKDDKPSIKMKEDYDGEFSYLYETDDKFMSNLVDSYEKKPEKAVELYKDKVEDITRFERMLKLIQEGDTGWKKFGMGTILDIDRYQTLNDLWSMQDSAYNKTRKDPIARSVVNNIQFFTIGRGIKFEAFDSKVQKVFEDFWRMNKMDLRQKEMIRSTYIEGEYFILYFVNLKNGNVKVRRIRPKEVYSIESHPDDIETIFAYRRIRDPGDERYYADVDYFENIEKDMNLKYSDKQSQVHDQLEEDKLVQFVKYGWNPDEIRGRVPMDCVMKHLKYYEDWLLDRVRLNHERSKVVWIKTVRGRGQETGVTKRRVPKGGVIFQESNNVKYRIENPQINADNVESDALSILYAIGSGVGMPLHVLNQRASETVYASIKKQETPYSQNILDNQDFWRANFDKMFRVLIREKVKAKQLKDTVSVPKYEKEKIFEAYHRINEMVTDGKNDREIGKEVKNILEGKHTMMKVNTVDIPISIIFPEVVKEDPWDQARVLNLHYRMGIASSQSLSEIAGYNWQEELYRMRVEKGIDKDDKEDKDDKDSSKPGEKATSPNSEAKTV